MRKIPCDAVDGVGISSLAAMRLGPRSLWSLRQAAFQAFTAEGLRTIPTPAEPRLEIWAGGPLSKNV